MCIRDSAYIAENIRLVRISGVFQPLLEALIGLTFLVVLWYGGGQVLSGRISLGSFVMFNTYMGILVWPMIALGWVVNLMQRGGASLARINQILQEKPTIAVPAHPVPMARVRGEIEFRDVSVQYPSGLSLIHISIRTWTTPLASSPRFRRSRKSPARACSTRPWGPPSCCSW